jgi:hypothetical protein
MSSVMAPVMALKRGMVATAQSQGSINDKMQDPRLDLERLPSENLYDIARNSAATHRKLAMQILVERGSHLACRDEIDADAKE